MPKHRPEPVELSKWHAAARMYPGEPFGAYPKGTVVMKIDGPVDDLHAIGTQGVVQGSVRHPETGEIGYLLRMPDKQLVFIKADKIMKVEA